MVTSDVASEDISTVASVSFFEAPTAYVTVFLYPSNAAFVSVIVYVPYGAFFTT